MELREAEKLLRDEGREYELIITTKERVRFPRKKGINYPRTDRYRVIGQSVQEGKVILWATEDISSELLMEKLGDEGI